MNDLKAFIRQVPDFPKEGVTFYDVTTLFQDPVGFKAALDGMESYIRSRDAEKIVGVESRGFVVGAALADRLGMPFILARKPGKLPFKTISEEYSLEYGTDRVEMHCDAISKGDKVIVADDLIATGGTLVAVCSLVKKLGGDVVGISSVVALDFLPYRDNLAGYDISYLVSYDSE